MQPRPFLACALTLAATATLFAPRPRAAESASATIAERQVSPTSYEYTLKLTDTGTTPISTFWFGWFPGYDLLPSAPTKITSPAGWTGTNAPDIYGVASVQWVNTDTPLQPGQSLTGFVFDSPDAPPTINGTSQYFGLPTYYSYVYAGPPETDAGFPFSPTVVPAPEPASTAGLLLLAAVAIGRLARRCPVRVNDRPR